MELAWFSNRKPSSSVDHSQEQRPSRRPDKLMPSDWAWAAMMLALAGVGIYCVHTGPDGDFPAGRTPVYGWIIVAALALAPLYLLPHFAGPRRANAYVAALGATGFWLGMLYLAAWPASEKIFYDPFSAKTWDTVISRLPTTPLIWLFIVGLAMITAWISAFLAFTSHKPRIALQPRGRGREPRVRAR